MKFEEERWRAMTEDVSYSESYQERQTSQDQAEESTGGSGGFELLKYFFYALIIGVVIFLIAKLLSQVNSNPYVRPTLSAEVTTVEEAEERIHEADLEGLLQKALSSGDYRLATRVDFLMLIRSLSEKNMISWAKEKTNWQYYSELRDRLLADQFREVVLSFERAWYGEHTMNEQQYHKTLPAFQAIQARIAA